jgi:hypothetical protein
VCDGGDYEQPERGDIYPKRCVEIQWIAFHSVCSLWD